MATAAAVATEQRAMEQQAEEPAGASAVILSAAVADAVARADAKLAFDMLLVHEQMRAGDAERRASGAEAAALREALAGAKQEQSAMYVHLHGQLDAQVARVEALERALADAQADAQALEAAQACKLLEVEAVHQQQLTAADEQAARLREELRAVRAFAERQQELEGELSMLRTRLAAAEEDAAAREAALERKFLAAEDRGKRELLARVQATKEALEVRTAGQLPTTTKRTMLENAHFVEELAFQSRESEALVARADRLDADLRALRAKNAVLEANEAALARKAHYYRRMLQAARGRPAAGGAARRNGGDSDSDEDDEGDKHDKDDADKRELQERVEELQRKLARALEWLRVLETDKQLLLARQDEVLQFLLGALDEGSRQLRCEDSDARLAQAGATTSVDALVALFPRPMVPALDELETRALLRFLVEKLRVYQQQVAAVFHAPSPSPSPSRRPAKTLELPPIGAGGSPAKAKTKDKTATSPLQRRACFAHVSAAVTREEEAAAARVAAGHAELLGLATEDFNFLSAKRKGVVLAATSPAKAPAAPSPARRPPPAKTRVKAAPSPSLAPDASTELLAPWPAGEEGEGAVGVREGEL